MDDGSKGDFLSREYETGHPRLFGQSSLIGALANGKFSNIVTMLTTSCFAGTWSNSHEYTLIAGFRNPKAFPNQGVEAPEEEFSRPR